MGIEYSSESQEGLPVTGLPTSLEVLKVIEFIFVFHSFAIFLLSRLSSLLFNNFLSFLFFCCFFPSFFSSSYCFSNIRTCWGHYHHEKHVIYVMFAICCRWHEASGWRRRTLSSDSKRMDQSTGCHHHHRHICHFSLCIWLLSPSSSWIYIGS